MVRKNDAFIQAFGKKDQNEMNQQFLETIKKEKFINSYGIIGVLCFSNQHFLLHVLKAKVVNSLINKQIYKVKKIEFLVLSQAKNWEDYNFNINILEEIKFVFHSGFYFSYNYRLTQSIQRQLETNEVKIDMNYFWNHSLANSIYQIDKEWIIPLIQGCIIIHEYTEHKARIALIARRRHLNGGTRFQARGIDDDGNTANFVESEMILETETEIYSWIITRGSVPIFWTQKGITAKLSLTRPVDSTFPAFRKHCTDLLVNYSSILFINLLSVKRARENLLIKGFEDLFKKYVEENSDEESSNKVKYLYYNYFFENKKKEVLKLYRMSSY